MYKAATIFLFLFLLSCTVTKRVHRPGFHVEWKKNYRVQNDVSTTIDVQEKGNAKSEERIDKRVSSRPSAELAQVAEIQDSKNDASTLLSVQVEKKKKTKSSTHVQKQAYSFFVEKTRRYAPLKMPKVQKKTSRNNGYVIDGFRNVGFVLLAVGGFLLIGSLLSYFGFWLMEELFYSLVFSGNGIIASIFGFLLFLIILIVVFISFAIVHYLLGGAYVGFLVSLICIGVGLLCLLVSASI